MSAIAPGPHKQLNSGLLASLGRATHAPQHFALRALLQHQQLPGFSAARHFSASQQSAAAQAAEQSADDVVAKVLSCAAANDTETGVLSQVRRVGAWLGW